MSFYAYKLGRRSAVRPVGYKAIACSMASAPPEAPDNFDPLSGVTPFKMLGNGPDPTLTVNGGNPVGDCGFVMTVNANVVTTFATGRWFGTDPAFVMPSANVVVTDYLRYDHGDDQGVVNSELLPYWKKTGLWGNKIQGYGSVNFHDFDELMAYTHSFYCVCLGIAVSEAMMEATQNGDPWDYKGTSADNNILGGHDVLPFGKDGDYGILATWGQRQLFTKRWLQHCAEECDAVVTAELVAAKPGLVDVAKLDHYLNGIAA